MEKISLFTRNESALSGNIDYGMVKATLPDLSSAANSSKFEYINSLAEKILTEPYNDD